MPEVILNPSQIRSTQSFARRLYEGFVYSMSGQPSISQDFEPRHRFRDNTILVNLQDSELSVLRARNPGARILINQTFEVPFEEEIGAASEVERDDNWGSALWSAPWLHSRGLDGRRIKVGVLDSGIDPSHPAFAHGPLKGFALFRRDGSRASDLPADTQWHGTHVASLIAGREENVCLGLAPLVDLYVGSVLQGWHGSVASIKAGLEWLLYDVKPDIVNLSLGWPGYHDEWYETLEKLTGRGTLVIAAIGNEFLGANKARSPAIYPLSGLVSVGACNRDGVVWEKSGGLLTNWPAGSVIQTSGVTTPAIVAPGVDIIGSSPGSSYRLTSGSSQAAPHVTGLVAAIASSGRLTVHEALDMIYSAVDDTPPAGEDIRTGRGVVNIGRLQSALTQFLEV